MVAAAASHCSPELRAVVRQLAACAGVSAPSVTLSRQVLARRDALDQRLFEDGGDDLEIAAAVRAVLEVDLEVADEQPWRKRKAIQPSFA